MCCKTINFSYINNINISYTIINFVYYNVFRLTAIE